MGRIFLQDSCVPHAVATDTQASSMAWRTVS
jgi:hypothetical protein